MAKIKTLRRCRLFQNLSFRDLAVLARHVEEGDGKAGSYLAREGEPTQGLIVLRSGKVRLFHSSAPQECVEIGTDDYFGELSLADPSKTRAVNAEVLQQAEFLKITPVEFEKLRSGAADVAGRISLGILSATTEKLDFIRSFIPGG